MSNSSLVTYTKISPNRTTKRTHAIDTITIHCMAGDLSLEACGNLFAKATTAASSNYGIDSKGRIGLFVPEDERSWASSNRENDMRAVTIEVANIKNAKGGYDSDWPVSDEAYEALIKLCVDICKRNNIKSLKWKASKSLIGKVEQQNMTVHRWFKNKACPGDYLYNRMGDIADRVNKELNGDSEVMYKVIAGSYKVKKNAEKLVEELKNKGYDAIVVKDGEKYLVQAGVFSSKQNATSLVNKLKLGGYSARIARAAK